MNTMLRICRRRGVSWDRKAEILNMAFICRGKEEKLGAMKPFPPRPPGVSLARAFRDSRWGLCYAGRMLLLAAVSLAIWLYLLTGHGQFWQSGPSLPPTRPTTAPAVNSPSSRALTKHHIPTA